MILATSNPTLWTQLAAAIPFAVAATVYPPALAVLIYYLNSPSPKRLVIAYACGAFAMTLVVGIAGILFLGSAQITPRDHPAPSAALDIVLGVLMLVAAELLSRRKGRETKEGEAAKRRSGRAVSAAALGVVMYTPSLFYLAALNLVAEADPSVAGAVVSALVLTVCVLLFVEIPIVLYLLFPASTDAALKRFNAWVHRRGRQVLTWGFRIGGLYLLGEGIAHIVAI